ncbi:hypothetical protein [Halalkalibacter urbisdiaboli]|uniref:hypothetical protein n=1 Tax=Halalkalibacter urbisdiaboli TaxID=1960589 RepID=UPI0013FD2C49|nr:hypothetical protein [Halalkalibacter urbisdiaboli]
MDKLSIGDEVVYENKKYQVIHNYGNGQLEIANRNHTLLDVKLVFVTEVKKELKVNK